MAKKVNIGKKPSSNKVEQMEEWVSNRNVIEADANNTEEKNKNKKVSSYLDSPKSTKPKKVKMKRLTLDIDEQLHKAIKMKSVQEETPMADLLRDLLRQHFL